MNIIIANKYQNLLNNPSIQKIKELDGCFSVNEIVNSINGMFFQRLIIDATAIQGYPRKEVIKEISKRIETDKLIIFIPPDNTPPTAFLSFLVSNNIYNFTDSLDGILKLISKSNTLNDVSQYATKLPVNNSGSDNNTSVVNNQPIKTGMNQKLILGIRDVTNNAGSTELVYLLKKNLTEVYKRNVVAVEVDKRDAIFYNDKNFFSISSNQIEGFIREASFADIILIALNQDDLPVCTDILYLVEPSMYRFNELLFKQRNIFNILRGKKIIFNKCLLEEKDVNTLAKTNGISVYYTLPPLNDIIINPKLNELLMKMGLVSMTGSNNDKRGLFGIFK